MTPTVPKLLNYLMDQLGLTRAALGREGLEAQAVLPYEGARADGG